MIKAIINNDTTLTFGVQNFSRNTNFRDDTNASRIFLVSIDPSISNVLNILFENPFLSSITLINDETNTVIYNTGNIYGTIVNVDESLNGDVIYTQINIQIEKLEETPTESEEE